MNASDQTPPMLVRGSQLDNIPAGGSAGIQAASNYSSGAATRPYMGYLVTVLAAQTNQFFLEAG